MRRAASTTITVLCLLLALMLVATGVTAQEEPAPSADHPIVGTWAFTDGGTATFDSDGTLIALEPTGGVGLGAWLPSGERTAEITFRVAIPGSEDAPGGIATARGTTEVSEDGMSLAITATAEFPTPDGGTTGQLGPTEHSATRLVVEPMGEPVGPVPEEMSG